MCGEIPPCTAAWRAHTRRRRRTSEVDSRRPDFERKSAWSPSPAASAGRRALEVARDGAQRRLAGGHDPRLGALALDAQLLGVEADRGHVEVDELLGAQAAGVGHLEQRPVAQLERRGGRDPVQQRRELVGAQHRGQRARALGRRDQVDRVLGHLAVLAQRAVEGAQRGELARDGGGDGVAPGEHGGVAAQLLASPRRAGRRPAPCTTARTARGRRRRRGASSRPSRGGAGRSRTAPAPRARPRWAAAYPPRPWGCSSSTPATVRSPPIASSSTRAPSARTGCRRARGIASRARPTPRRCGSRSCAGVSGASSSARWCFDTPTTMPCFWSAGGRRSRSTRSGAVI